MRGEEHYRERKEHGEKNFPFNIYPCCIPVDFPSVGIHWHSEMELIVIKKGRGIVKADLAPFFVQAGEAVVVFPGQLHGLFGIGGERMEYENIIFQPGLLFGQADEVTTSFLLPFLAEGRQATVHIRAESPGYAQFMECVRVMDAMGQEKPYGYQLAIKGALFGCLFEILLHYRQDTSEEGRKHREKLKELLSFVEKHYGEPISVEQAAAMCFYSKSHFMKFFRQNMGTSFIEYVNDYRLSHAAGLLGTTTTSVTQIAQQCGFDNISYFNRIFRRKYNMAPLTYRKSLVIRTSV